MDGWGSSTREGTQIVTPCVPPILGVALDQ